MKIGQVVHLNSGGVNMTVSHISSNGRKITCQWFDGTRFQTKNFNESNLVILEDTKTTHVIQVMDGSGSMRGIWDEIQGMLGKQWEVHAGAARDGQDVRMTTFVFDDEIYPPVIENRNPNEYECPKLTIPGGMTALRDAIGTAIKLAQSKFNDGPDEAVLIQIFSDGFENKSSEWTHEAINAEITRLQETKKWTFQFIGANQIAEHTAHKLGIHRSNAIRFRQSTGGVRGMSAGLAQSNQTYYSARTAGAMSVEDSFGDGEDKSFTEDGSTAEGKTETAPDLNPS